VFRTNETINNLEFNLTKLANILLRRVGLVYLKDISWICNKINLSIAFLFVDIKKAIGVE
jgi:hypothetical protein